MKKTVALLLLLALILSGCNAGAPGNSPENSTRAPGAAQTQPPASAPPQSKAPGEHPAQSGGVLIAYFSIPEDVDPAGADAVSGASIVAWDGQHLGNTQYVAQVIQETVGGDLFRIETVQQYPLDHDPLVDQASDEKAASARPELSTSIENLEQYDTILIGYPIWWGIAAWPVNDFVKNNDFTGKTVIPFCTSTSSGLGQSGQLLAEMAGTGDWQAGQRFSSGASQEQVAQWVSSLVLDSGTPEPSIPGTDGPRVLVTYFSMPETTKPDHMTTEEDNSVVVINGQVLGNTQYMAQVIQETIGGDIFRIEPVTPYPTDHSTLVSLASQEQSANARPAIQGGVDMDDYDVVFVGYPIWWSDMPMILYTFFEQYDLSGKTVVPFSTHGGSSFAGTPATIQSLEPDARMLDGLTISRNNIQDARQEIVDWVNGLVLN